MPNRPRKVLKKSIFSPAVTKLVAAAALPLRCATPTPATVPLPLILAPLKSASIPHSHGAI
jgi:hypothetical protein